MGSREYRASHRDDSSSVRAERDVRHLVRVRDEPALRGGEPSRAARPSAPPGTNGSDGSRRLATGPPGVSGGTAPSDDRRTEALVRAAHAHSCAKIAEWCRAASLERRFADPTPRGRARRSGIRAEKRGIIELSRRRRKSEPRGVDGNWSLARTEGDGERPSPPIGAAVPIGGAPEPNRAAAERHADGEIRRRVLFAAQHATRDEPDERDLSAVGREFDCKSAYPRVTSLSSTRASMMQRLQAPRLQFFTVSCSTTCRYSFACMVRTAITSCF